MYEVERHQRKEAIQSLLLSLVFPGAWRLFRAQTMTAFFFGCLWFGGLIHLFLRPRLWPLSTDFLAGPSLNYSLVMMALVVVWGLGNIGLVRVRPNR